MPLRPAALKQEWDNANLQEIKKTEKALSKWGRVTAKYIRQNALINFTWVALSPPPASLPDPIVVATGKIVSLQFPLVKSSDRSVFEVQMSDLLSLGLYNITDPGFGTTPIPFGKAVTPPNLDLSNLESDVKSGKISRELATRIVLWIQSQVPTVPVPGAHGSFIGAPGGMVVKIL